MDVASGIREGLDRMISMVGGVLREDEEQHQGGQKGTTGPRICVTPCGIP